MEKRVLQITGVFLIALILTSCSFQNSTYIINVSYDATREFYEEYNELFVKHWKEKTGKDIEIIQSHGGSGKQALEVANGLEADVTTLALEQDIDRIKEAGIIDDNYIDEFDDNSAPYTSTIVFLVRKNNPKQINDWEDLLRKDVDVITPNPKTSGGARWNYLAAWYYFEKQGQTQQEILNSMKKLFDNVLVLDSGARASTTTFVENGQGDVLLSWENEAFFCLKEHPGEYEIVIPSVSILCQPTIAVVDEMVRKHDTQDVANEYLNYLYDDKSQKLIADSFYRPVNSEIYREHSIEGSERTITSIPKDGKWIVSDVELTDINHFGGWNKVTEVHFSEDGFFDSFFK